VQPIDLDHRIEVGHIRTNLRWLEAGAPPAYLLSAQWSDVMKRDLDLARQLLLEIEGRGADCSVSVLRTGPNHEAEERIRYHLRLLIDAGLLKEVDRTAGGVPCLRLTDAGHETIELTRSEARWRDAKFACQERTGGLSLGVIRNLLSQWAVELPRFRPRRRYAIEAPALVEGRYRGRRSPYRFEPLVESELDSTDDEVRYVRVRPARFDGWRYDGGEVDGVRPVDFELEPTLPEYLL
jgi:hypothetical protein